VGGERVDEVVVEGAALQAAGGVHRQQPFDASFAVLGLGAEPRRARSAWLLVLSRYRDNDNNHAERALRFAVLLRKRSGGTRTDHGDRYIERLLTVGQTCRLQGRNLHDCLLAAITAALHGRPAPSLLPAGP
jgi:hypothetical protein